MFYPLFKMAASFVNVDTEITIIVIGDKGVGKTFLT